MAGPAVSHRLAPSLAARLLGLGLGLLGLVVFLVTLLIAVLELPAVVLGVVGVTAVIAVALLGWWLTRRATVLTLTPTGYRVRMVRGVGTAAARWDEVESLAAADVAGDRCIVLRLRAGTTTTIPVAAIATEPETLMRDLRDRLRTRP